MIWHAHQQAACHHWKGRTYFAVQCFWLLFSFWLSISRIFLQIHKSVGQQSFTSTDSNFYHFNNKTATCKFTTNPLLHDIFLSLIMIQFLMDLQANFCWLEDNFNWIFQSTEHKVMLFCGKSIISIVKCFLLCHTFSYHCTAIIVGLSNTLWT